MNGAESSKSGDAALDARTKAVRLLDALAASSCDRLLKSERDFAKRQKIDFGNNADDVLGTANSLCNLWWTGDAPEDKASVSLNASENASNVGQDLSPYYYMMLSVEIFAQYHDDVETGLIDVSSKKVPRLCRPSYIGPSSCRSKPSFDIAERVMAAHTISVYPSLLD